MSSLSWHFKQANSVAASLLSAARTGATKTTIPKKNRTDSIRPVLNMGQLGVTLSSLLFIKLLLVAKKMPPEDPIPRVAVLY
jgi:hypothetical protein